MSAHDEYMTKRQARDLARRLARLERKTRSTAAAHADLRHSSVDGGVFKIKDADGNTAYELGTDPTTGVTAPQFKGGPVPEQPSAPFVDVGGEVVKIQHSGLDVDENPAPADFRRAQIHVAQDEVFEPSLSTLAGYLEEADGSFTHRLPGGEWYVGIVWETLSGKTSVMSGTVLADIPPLVDTSDLEDTLAAAEEKLNSYRDEVAAPRFQALEEGLETHEANIEDARTRLSAAEQTLAPLPGRIESAEQDVATAQEDATKAAAAAVEANNRAMTRLANGNFENDLLYWDYQNVSLTTTAHSGQQAALVNGWLRPGSSFPVVSDQIWELSLYHQHDVTVEFQAVDGDQRANLSTHHLDGDSTWSDSGTLRVTIPADVHMLSFTITGTSAIVDDITLRDVTDVVRLEEAANANRQKAEQAISELAVMRLAVDGEGGLKDRLASAETVLETKADESALDQLDQKLRTDLAAFEAHYTRVWRQPTPPPAGTSYEWAGTRHASESIKRVDGVEVARNLVRDPRGKTGHFWAGVINPSEYGAWENGAGVVVKAGTNTARAGALIRDLDVQPGGYIAISFDAATSPETIQNSASNSYFRVLFYNLSTGWESSTRFDSSTDRLRHTLVLPNNDSFSRIYFDWYFHNLAPDQVVGYIDKVVFTVADTEEEALAQVANYWDGGTASDRANDLWYNGNGVPHEWVNGSGWTPISDARITELASQVDTLGDRLNTAETGLEEALEGPIDHDRLRVGTGAFDEAFASKLIADHATIINAAMRNLSVEEKLLFAEAIGEQIWAELGVFDRLQAREGWIGGTLLADGAVTAEKIHATREMITKIMGAEWAYIAEQLIVDGSILTRDLEALSAAIQSLTVTQRADIAQLWANELWTALAVIEELQAEEAWITSAMISELTAEKVTVTENFVGRVAELLHLVVDRIDVNSLWADQTWQAAGHFGSEEAEQSTLVDGTGLRITKHDHDNETSTDIVRLGGEGVGLVFSDEDGEVTGSLSHEGDASFRDTSVDRLTIGGRLLLPETDPAEFWDGNLWDSQPKGLVCFHEVNMQGVSVNHTDYGFIEVSHHVKANRRYRVSISNVRLTGSGTYYGHFKYTLGDQPSAPHTESPRLGQSWFLRNTATSGVSSMNDHVFTPEHDGLIRILFVVEGGSAGIEFAGISGYNQVQMRLEDLGPNRPYTGMTRTAGHGGSGTIRDPQPLTGSITTEWDMTWFQNYSNGGTIKRSASDNRTGYGSAGLTQGVREFGAGGDGIWNSLFGFTTSTNSTRPADLGVTLPAALNGAQPLSAYLEVQNMLAWHPDKHTQFPIGYHSHTTAPAQFGGYTQIQDTRIQEGTTARIPVPLDLVETLGRNGQLTGFGTTTTNTTSRYAGILSWNNRPKLVVTYQR